MTYDDFEIFWENKGYEPYLLQNFVKARDIIELDPL